MTLIGQPMIIEKRNPDGDPVVEYPGWLVRDGNPILILAQWERPSLVTPYVTFAQGDLLLEAYYRDRPYNVFALYDGKQLTPMDWAQFLARWGAKAAEKLCQHLPKNALKGYYINFTRPIQVNFAKGRLAWLDLALDLWMPTQGKPWILDEEEYRALHIDTQDPDLARQVEQARQALLTRGIQLCADATPSHALA